MAFLPPSRWKHPNFLRSAILLMRFITEKERLTAEVAGLQIT